MLCRILTYLVVICPPLLFTILVPNLSFLGTTIQVLLILGTWVAVLFYILKNFPILMGLDMMLGQAHCRNTARKRFALPKAFSVERAKRRLLRFGKSCTPTALMPKPQILQYQSKASWMIYSSGTEKVIVAYSVECLDKALYLSIVRSANANSKALLGKKKHFYLDKSQYENPLHRVTVIVLFANRVAPEFVDELSEIVCKQNGDGFDEAILPCVVDLETRFVTFDSERIVYTGLSYPVRNRGIRLIRKCLFGGKFTYETSPDTLEPRLDPEQSLWDLWRTLKQELAQGKTEDQQRYENMKHKELVFENGYIYLKYENRGVWLAVDLDEENKVAEVDAIHTWYYPRDGKIEKETIKELRTIITSYFATQGYQTKYLSLD